MAQKLRTRIPQENKVRAVLQQEINSKCPFCSNTDVGHFEIHHIDENPSNHKIENLLLLCSNCHSKITKKDISMVEVLEIKQMLKNKNSSIQFISVVVDTENCGWVSYKNTPNAFQADNFKSLFPIFTFTFINNSDKTILLTNIVITNKHFPVGLSGPYVPLPDILRPIIKYKIKMPNHKETVNTVLKDKIEVPQGRAFEFQIELFSENMNDFKPPSKYALNLQFGFNNDFYIDIPKILLNSESDYDKLEYNLIN